MILPSFAPTVEPHAPRADYLPRFIPNEPSSALFSDAGVLIYGSRPSKSLEAFVDALGSSTSAAELEDITPGATGRKRGGVVAFSRKSIRRLTALLVELAPGILASKVLREAAFISLTYGKDAPNPRQAKRDLNHWLVQVRRQHPALSAVWVFELQKRGAPHFHLLTLGPGVLEPGFGAWAKDGWIGITGLGGSKEADRELRAVDVRPLDEDEAIALGLIDYLVKELTKSRQKSGRVLLHLEDPGRFWGVHNRSELVELRETYPPPSPVVLHPDDVPVLKGRLRAVSTVRMPDGLIRYYANRHGNEAPEFVRVGFDHLGAPGRYLRTGATDVLGSIRSASQRFHCKRYGYCGYEYEKPARGTLDGRPRVWFRPADVMLADEFKSFKAEDRSECFGHYPAIRELHQRYPAAGVSAAF